MTKLLSVRINDYIRMLSFFSYANDNIKAFSKAHRVYSICYRFSHTEGNVKYIDANMMLVGKGPNYRLFYNVCFLNNV